MTRRCSRRWLAKENDVTKNQLLAHNMQLLADNARLIEEHAAEKARLERQLFEAHRARARVSNNQQVVSHMRARMIAARDEAVRTGRNVTV